MRTKDISKLPDDKPIVYKILVERVTQRIEHEVGLSRAAAMRIARKLNTLARSVEWATPVGNGGRGVKKRSKVHRRAVGKSR